MEIKLKSNRDKDNIKSLAIGGFDGMHIGHQKLFSKLDKEGGVLVIERGEANLTPNGFREKLTTFPIFYLELQEIISLTPENFIGFLKDNFKNLQKIVVGYDFRFGYQRSGDIELLKKIYDKIVEVVDEVKVDEISVHSRIIKGFIRVGDIITANRLLGRKYAIYGEVIKGQGLGMRKLFPTLNLNCKSFLLPNEGVYITKTIIDNKKFNSVSFVGHRVTTDGSFSVETHLIDKNINGIEFAGIEFIDKLRDNKMFANLKMLKTQIAKDIENAKEFFKSLEPRSNIEKKYP